MKLELKHLAPYLPYELNIQNNSGDFHKMTGYTLDAYFIKKHTVSPRPILRPLSDFNKGLYSEIFKTFYLNWQNSEDFCLTPIGVNSVSYELANILIKNHFDIFGLIEKGLAINVNTL